ncbi:aspartic proteinase CDR1-like protein [Tanacetum coccineum]
MIIMVRLTKKGSGIIGLGGGPLSLVKQLENVIQGKFSYCLIPYFNDVTNQTSKMQFRDYAKVTGPTVVSTPLVKKDPSTYYYLTLESVLVGKNNVSSNKSFSKKDVQEGNIIIDSGTTLTFIDQELYEESTSGLTEVLGSPTAQDPDGFFQYCCYKDLNMDTVPTVTFRFTGADVELPPLNTFLEVQKGMSCLTIVVMLSISATVIPPSSAMRTTLSNNGNGETTKFWEDKWCEEGTLKDIYPRELQANHSWGETVSA